MDRDKDYYRLRERLTISVKWSAYEALKRKMFNEKSDLWSYGVCAWEVFTYGDVPYRSVPLTQVVAEMTKGTRPARPPGCPVDIWKYIATCWHPDVSKRWDFVQALAEVMTLLEKHPLKQPRRDIGKALKEKKLDVPVSV
jgi:serine/threonine protein kinase